MTLNNQKENNFLKVAVTGGAGQIAYSLLPFIINGDIFGKNTAIDLRLLEISQMMQKLKGVEMEIQDCLQGVQMKITCTDSLETAFTGIDYAILLGGFPRQKGMERKDLLLKNQPIFVQMGKALSEFAGSQVKVLVVANPANTNALILYKNSNLQKENITAMSRLDLNRAAAFLARDLNVSACEIEDVAIWGNHSKTQIPDLHLAKIKGVKIDMPMIEMSEDEFITRVQNRGEEVLNAKGMSSAMSAASAIRDHLKDWHFGTNGKITSMSVISDGNPYGIAQDLFFSFPVIISNESWKIASDFDIGEGLMTRIKITEAELLEEKKEAGLE